MFAVRFWRLLVMISRLWHQTLAWVKDSPSIPEIVQKHISCKCYLHLACCLLSLCRLFTVLLKSLFDVVQQRSPTRQLKSSLWQFWARVYIIRVYIMSNVHKHVTGVCITRVYIKDEWYLFVTSPHLLVLSSRACSQSMNPPSWGIILWLTLGGTFV